MWHLRWTVWSYKWVRFRVESILNYSICDSRKIKFNRCPCSSCLQLYLDGTALAWNKPTAPTADDLPDSGSTSSAARSTEDSKCVICLDREKTTLFIPCGHYAFCKLCADGIVECAICRTRIQKRVKVFES